MATDTTFEATAIPAWRAWVFSWRGVLLVTLLAAIGVSGYLSYVKATDVAMVCTSGGAFDCGTVQNSVYSEIFGVPIAWLGLGWNFLILGTLLFEDRLPILQTYGLALLFGLVTFGFLYSVYLVYLQAFVIEAFCQWCLMHEALYTVLMIAIGVRVWGMLRGTAA
ncbi:MAG: vitamin K epoxide reductase family protein [Anaerolineales bacterium]